jgi:predicted kinase
MVLRPGAAADALTARARGLFDGALPGRSAGHSTTLDAEGRKRRARAAGLASRRPDHPDIAAFRAEAAERYIRKLVDSFPPLTQEQRARLATLLAGGGDGDAVAS